MSSTYLIQVLVQQAQPAIVWVHGLTNVADLGTSGSADEFSKM
jgi:hypothetical protein